MLQSIAIVGGSLGGLYTGIALLKKGYDVHIYERSSGRMEDRGGGLVIQDGIQDFFNRYCLASLTDYSVPLTYRQFLNKQGDKEKMHMAQPMTSWNRLYHILREHFPLERYHPNKRLNDYQQTKDDVTLFFEDGTNVTADLVVGADGIGSTLRQYLLPDAKPEYAGYVAWRGTMSIEELPKHLRELFYDHFTFYTGPETQILTYFIPNMHQEDPIRANFVWYVNLLDKDKLEQVMTQDNGRKLDFVLPPNKVSSELVKELKEEAVPKLLPPQFQELVQLTEQPYAQPIYDLTVSKMVFNRILLLGDAAFVPRPHTGAGVNKAAHNALSLADYLPNAHEDVAFKEVKESLGRWEKEQLEFGHTLVRSGKRLGNQSRLGYGGQHLF